MIGILVYIFAVGFASADVGLGYHYKPPPTPFGSYGVPSNPTYQGSASSGQYNIDYNNANGLNYKFPEHNGYAGLNLGFQNSGNSAYRVNGGNQGFKPAFPKGDSFGSNSFQNSVNKYQSGYNGGNIHRETTYQSENFASHLNVYGGNKAQTFQNVEIQSQPAQVFKHFYIHAAPEDEEPPKPRTPIVLPPPQKHYKIIFIKAPSQLASAPQVVPVVQQNEEKTIVYVLVNKPEEAQNIVVPKVEQKPPAKPEVYFIKYNNKEGSQAVIENIVKDYNKGQSASFTNVGTGVAPPSLLLGTFGTSDAQTANSESAGLLSVQNTPSSGFNALSTQSQTGSNFETNPLTFSTSQVSDGTLASTIVGTGNTDTFKVDNGYSGALGGTEFNSASSSTGFNGASSNAGINGAASNVGFNGVSSTSGFNSASSSTGLNSVSGSTGIGSVSSGTLNEVSGGSGFNNAFGNEYSSTSVGNEQSTTSGIASTGISNSVTDSQYNGSTISTSQGVPHETYGIPKFRQD